MFAYSLSGLRVDPAAAGDVLEVEESELTARSAVYQVLGQLFSPPDAEHHAKARDGRWVKELGVAAELLAFPWSIGECPDPGEEGAHVAEYERLLLADAGGLPRVWGGAHGADRDQLLIELQRSYEYYGLGAGDPSVPPDHLTVELDFLQFLTFKEAAASSPRLGKSFRRAQLDFTARQLGSWLPTMAAQVSAEGPNEFWAWAMGRLTTFVGADAAWAAG
jgi:DMSO reductase family type II enzyme chaperone